MKRILSLYFIPALLAFTACKSGNGKPDASGVFEADEVMVSAEVSGKILQFAAEEGAQLQKDQQAALIDTTILLLQKEQVEASIGALQQKTSNLQPYIDVLRQQLDVQKAQLTALEREQKRIANLVKADAATTKQLDDVNAQVDVLREQMKLTQRQIEQQQTTIGTQNRSILSEQAPLEKKKAQAADQLNRARVLNPINGTVLTKYVNAGELVMAGKPLYKIADLSQVNLRAYIAATQLSKVKLNQSIAVRIDDGEKNYRNYTGTLIWISDKAEFTPKTIQTKEERANLVYAIKVRVKNDGFLKLGMYGEITGIEQ